MAFAFLSFLLVVDLCPGAFDSAEVCPQVHGGSELLVAGAADSDLMHLPGLKTDRGGTSVAL